MNKCINPSHINAPRKVILFSNKIRNLLYEIRNPSKFESFLTSLNDKKIIQIGQNHRITVENPQRLNELGLGFFLLWVHTHKSNLRQNLPIQFINFSKDQTLFTSPSCNRPSCFYSSNKLSIRQILFGADK